MWKNSRWDKIYRRTVYSEKFRTVQKTCKDPSCRPCKKSEPGQSVLFGMFFFFPSVYIKNVYDLSIIPIFLDQSIKPDSTPIIFIHSNLSVRTIPGFIDLDLCHLKRNISSTFNVASPRCSGLSLYRSSYSRKGTAVA